MRTAAILALWAIFQIQQVAAAEEFPKSPSTWHGEMKRNGEVISAFCLQVTHPLVPIAYHRPTPKKCMSLSATMLSPPTASRGDLVSGYFCEEESDIGFFALPLPSDNSLAGPNI